MNIFVLDKSPIISAQMQCDKHIVKMPLETAQMLCSVWHRYGQGMNVPYKEAHKNHPCTLWAMETRSNYEWAFYLYREIISNDNKKTEIYTKLNLLFRN